MNPDPLVVELVEAQKRRGESNTEFAQRIGVHRNHWIGVKMGRYTAGAKIELGAERLRRAEEDARREDQPAGA